MERKRTNRDEEKKKEEKRVDVHLNLWQHGAVLRNEYLKRKQLPCY